MHLLLSAAIFPFFSRFLSVPSYVSNTLLFLRSLRDSSLLMRMLQPEMTRQQLLNMQGTLSRMLKRAMAGAREKYQQLQVYANRAGGGTIRRLPMAFEKWQFTVAETD